MNFALSKTKTILGIPLYRKYRAEKGLKRVFLGGIYREIVTFEDYGEASRQSSLLGIPVWGRRLNQQAISWHIGSSLIVKKISIAKELSFQLESIFSKMPVRPVNGRKHIFIFWANSGEIALLLMFFWKQLLERYGINDPEQVVVLCTKQYHQDMLRLYFPEIRSVVSKPKILRYVLDDLEAGDWFVHMCFPGKYFAQFEATCKAKTINYLKWMSKWLFLPISEIAKPNALQLQLSFDKAINKLTDNQKRALYEGRLIILALESFSSDEMPESLSVELIKKLEKDGYEIYDNSKILKSDMYLTYPEIFSIAKRSAHLYALRSGLVDFLLNTGIPLHIYYTEFKERGFNTPHRTAEEVFRLFTVKQLPLDNAIKSEEVVISCIK